MNLVEANLNKYLTRQIEPATLSLFHRIKDFISEQNVVAYVVGGWVRDQLLGRQTVDIDIALKGDTLEIAPRLADALSGRFVLLDEVNRISRVVLFGQGPANPTLYVDLSSFDKDIETDLARRDFTVDAMAVDLHQLTENPERAEVIDPFHGTEDIENKLIRAVSSKAFSEDALRLMRAVRLSAELDFEVEKETEDLIRQSAHLISGVAGERLREELLRILTLPRAAHFLFYLDSLGLLTVLFPELVTAKGVDQPTVHFWDVFDHSINTVKALSFLFGEGTWEYADGRVLGYVPWSARLAEHFSMEVSSGSTRRIILKLAALLHDVGKPQTKTLDASGRARFLGHGKLGATLVTATLEKLRLSAREIKLIETEIVHHLRPNQMSQENLPTARATYRYFRDTGSAGIDILFLSLADHLAARGPTLDIVQWQGHTRLVAYVLKQYFEQENLTHPSKLVDGHDIMNIFGVVPGPKVGELLAAVHEAQASGEVKTREEALDFIHRYLTSQAE